MNQNQTSYKDKLRKPFNENMARVGSEKVLAEDSSIVQQALRNRFERKQLLRVPKEIEAQHPDKHFVFINMNKLEKHGYYHPNGYVPFRCSEDKDDISAMKFSKASDGLVHRNEMVLAYIPKEDYQQQLLEDEIYKGKRDLTEIFTANPILSQSFSPSAKVEQKKETMAP